jgi:hypothetical protein
VKAVAARLYLDDLISLLGIESARFPIGGPIRPSE